MKLSAYLLGMCAGCFVSTWLQFLSPAAPFIATYVFGFATLMSYLRWYPTKESQ